MHQGIADCSCGNLHRMFCINITLQTKQENTTNENNRERATKEKKKISSIIYFIPFSFEPKQKKPMEMDCLWQHLISYIYMRTLVALTNTCV